MLNTGMAKLMPSPMVPVVSFRKKMNRKTRDSHFEKAVDMAKLLEQLVDFCPFDNLVQPPTLKNPVVEYHGFFCPDQKLPGSI
jgi:hypothetical protein